ncbi:hypothetical protein [Schlesneria sp. T3-172]|uniref:hypothetical protein n=1 Tax=Schlesneria sphaerica TaxID=3373610 RepID=UPI0037CCC351
MTDAKIKPGLLTSLQIDDSLFADLQSRDVALWLGTGVGTDEEGQEAIASLASLPWLLVLCESSSGGLAKRLDYHKNDPRLTAHRGFLDVVAANPEDISLPTRTLPVFMLNGRDDSDDPSEKPSLTRQKQQLRRLNMLKRLQDERPRHLIVVSSGDGSIIEELADLWDEGFRARLTFVSSAVDEAEKLSSAVVAAFRLGSATVIQQGAAAFANDIVSRSQRYIETESILVRIHDSEERTRVIDVTSCERPDQPLLDRYDLIQERHLVSLQPDELSEEELDAFFHRSSESWRPYAAGVPWIANFYPERQLLKALKKAQSAAGEENRIVLLQSEAGAGGTTLMKHLAYVAATNGYPTLVARQLDFLPEPQELTGFLHSFHMVHSEAACETSSETAVCIAFDAQHWFGRENEAAAFFKAFERAGRSVVILLVANEDGAARIPSEAVITLETNLSHRLSEDDAVDLGKHLNRFLGPKGKSRSESEWRQFHHANAPIIGDFGASNVSFWIALEFWLKRQMNLGDSIQEWLYSQFSGAPVSLAVKRLILQIAALTVERVAVPEEFMQMPTGSSLPATLQLEDARTHCPALGLTRNQSATQRQWSLGHPQIARYLLNIAFRDRQLLTALGLPEAETPIVFRLELLRSIACHPLLGSIRYKSLAVEFAQSVFKLDRDGNREFFAEWSRVLGILESIPERVWETSRVFNHHVAISRRRIAIDEEFFPLTAAQKYEQLEAAAEHITFALEHIDSSDDDDSDLNLLNSLARCYQDLAQLVLTTDGSPDRVTAFRNLASDCIRRAKELNASNSYVLETLAKDLIQKAQSIKASDPANAATAACEALTHVRQALALESGLSRQSRLRNLLSQSFALLCHDTVSTQIQTMRSRGDTIGIVAAAWLELRRGVDPWTPLQLDSIDNERIDLALAILDEVPAGKQTEMDLRLTYDLVSQREPYNFSRQHDILDAFVQETARTDYQTRLEYAILLFQTGRIAVGKQLYDDLRHDLRRSDLFVTIPNRLKILCRQGSSEPQVCTATVVEERDTRSWAAVQDLKRERVPFNPKEFDRKRMPVGQRFQCYITFGPNGPFIKPVKGASK